MSHAVSSHEASPESFARILNRLTHAPTPDSPSSEEPVRLSISERGAALGNSRKRNMIPVPILSRNSSRNNAEAAEISYERALRLHRRVSPSELPPAAAPAVEQATRKRRSPVAAAPPAETAKAAKSAQELTTSKKTGAPARKESAGAREKSAGKRPAARGAQQAHPEATVSSTTVSAKALPASPITPANPVARKQRKVPNSFRSTSRRAAKAKFSSAPESLPVQPETIPPSETLQMELASRITALAQRQSIVSIRLNALESEQLRERAAESGISVSAYIRSCVLEAEHLRTQVKHALSEIRASQSAFPRQLPVAPEPAAPTLSLTSHPVRFVRTGFVGFFSGLFTLLASRLHR